MIRQSFSCFRWETRGLFLRFPPRLYIFPFTLIPRIQVYQETWMSYKPLALLAHSFQVVGLVNFGEDYLCGNIKIISKEA